MNGAQEKARLEEERRRQEVRLLCAALSLTLGYNWRSGGRASHLSWLAQEEEALQRARAEAEAVQHGGTRSSVDPLQGSKHETFVANGRRKHA